MTKLIFGTNFDKPKKVKPEGRMIGNCPSCKKPVYSDQSYHTTGLGKVYHMRCSSH